MEEAEAQGRQWDTNAWVLNHNTTTLFLLTELKLEGPKPQQEPEKKIPKAKGQNKIIW